MVAVLDLIRRGAGLPSEIMVELPRIGPGAEWPGKERVRQIIKNAPSGKASLAAELACDFDVSVETAAAIIAHFQ